MALAALAALAALDWTVWAGTKASTKMYRLHPYPPSYDH
jgi:hypothetical protein